MIQNVDSDDDYNYGRVNSMGNTPLEEVNSHPTRLNQQTSEENKSQKHGSGLGLNKTKHSGVSLKKTTMQMKEKRLSNYD